MSKTVILLGAGGHARVLLDALRCNQVQVLGYVDHQKSTGGIDVQYLGDDEWLMGFPVDDVVLVNGVGNIGRRQQLFDAFKARGFHFSQVVHPNAIISVAATLAEAVQVMAGAVVQAGASVGENAIINTRASVDHDCYIGRHSHVAVGAVLAGDVGVGERTLIGAGSTVIQNLCIGSDCVVGAGAAVIADVPSGKSVVGVPAHVLE